MKVTENSKKQQEITIVTSRPGFLIGKRGDNIDKMQVFFSSRMEKQVTINIEEARDHVNDWILLGTEPYADTDEIDNP